MRCRRQVLALAAAGALAAGGLTGCIPTGGGGLTLPPPPTCTTTWIGAPVGNWHDASSWSGAAVPSSSDVACTPAGSTVEIDADASVGSLLASGTILLTDAALELTAFSLYNSADTLTADGGTLRATTGAVLSLGSGSSLDGTTIDLLTVGFTGSGVVRGASVGSPTGVLRVQNGGVLVAGVGSDVDVETDLIALCSGGALSVSGDLEFVEAATFLTPDCPPGQEANGDERVLVGYDGRVGHTVPGAAIYVDVPFDNRGIVDLDGTLSLAAGNTSEGPDDGAYNALSTAATLEVRAERSVPASSLSGFLDGSLVIDAPGVVVDLTGGLVTVNSFSGFSGTVTGQLHVTDSANFLGVGFSDAAVTIGNAGSGSGWWSGPNLRLCRSTLRIDGVFTLATPNGIRPTPGCLAEENLIEVTTNGTVSAASSDSEIDVPLDNAGRVEVGFFNSVTLAGNSPTGVDTGTFDVASGGDLVFGAGTRRFDAAVDLDGFGEIRLDVDATLEVDGFTLDRSLWASGVIQGDLTVTGNLVLGHTGGATTFRSAPGDSALLSVAGGGVLETWSGFTLAGDATIHVQSGADLTWIGGDVSVCDGSTVVNDGTITASAGLVGTWGASSCDTASPAPLDLSTGVLDVAGDAAFDFAVTVPASANVTLRDGAVWRPGSASLAGTFIVEADPDDASSGRLETFGPVTLGGLFVVWDLVPSSGPVTFIVVDAGTVSGSFAFTTLPSGWTSATTASMVTVDAP